MFCFFLISWSLVSFCKSAQLRMWLSGPHTPSSRSASQPSMSSSSVSTSDTSPSPLSGMAAISSTKSSPAALVALPSIDRLDSTKADLVLDSPAVCNNSISGCSSKIGTCRYAGSCTMDWSGSASCISSGRLALVCSPLTLCCEYTNIFTFSCIFKVSITFLISFRLPLFRLYYLEITDIFPAFFLLNTLPKKKPLFNKGNIGNIVMIPGKYISKL